MPPKRSPEEQIAFAVRQHMPAAHVSRFALTPLSKAKFLLIG